MVLTLPPAFWGPPWAAPRPRAITELIHDGVLDTELAALLWLLVEARIPIVVAAGPSGVGKSTLLAALLELVPTAADLRLVLGPQPDLSWLPEAASLGWEAGEQDAIEQGPSEAGSAVVAPRADRSSAILVAPELSGHLPWYAWGSLARTLVRAASLGYGLATTVHGERLEDVLATLADPPVSLTEDEIGHLGVVVILRAVAPPPGPGSSQRRVVAAHLLRPPSRDGLGHVQRLGPAVLAARDERRDALEHYAWGVMPEIAHRVGRRAGDLQEAQGHRAELLDRLVVAGRLEPAPLSDALVAYREAHGGDPRW